MYCFGDWRSETFSFSPRASRSRSRWRIFSRSSATDFMRLSSTSGASTGMASVSTVATAATAASSAVSCLTPMLCIESISVQSIGCCSKVEVDHLLLDDRPEFALDRLLRVERNDLEAVEQR